MDNTHTKIYLSPREHIQFQELSQHDLSFWAMFGIPQKILEKYGIRSVLGYSYVNRKNKVSSILSSPNDPIFAYPVEKNVFKLYRPLSKSKGFKFRWFGKKKDEYIFGFEQLPNKGDFVIICAGEKDTLSTNSLGYPAICLNSETAKLSPGLLFELRKKFSTIFSLYDNDETGLKQAKRLLAESGVRPLIIPEFWINEERGLKGKDISDYVSTSQPLEWLESQIEDYLNEPKENEELKGINGLSMNLLTLLESSKNLRERISQTITFSKPIITQNGTPWIFPNTIAVIQGQTGTHKSRLVETIASAIIRKKESLKNPLGLNVNPFEEYSFIYIDTERNIQEQFPYSIQQIKLKAGYQIDEDVPNLDFTSLVEIPRDERVDTLEAYINHLRAISKSHLIIVLDVVTDCVLDFNRSEESMQFIQHLNKVINQNGVTFICIIHENPGFNTKARGHLGTELANKASTLIQIGFEKDGKKNDTDLVKLKFLKFRQGKRPENVFLTYDSQSKGLVLADAMLVKNVMDTKHLVADHELVADFIGRKIQESPLEKATLIQMLMEEFQISNKTARNRIKSILNNSLYEAVNKDGKLCLFDDFKDGKQVFLKLAPMNEKITGEDLSF